MNIYLGMGERAQAYWGGVSERERKGKGRGKGSRGVCDLHEAAPGGGRAFGGGGRVWVWAQNARGGGVKWTRPKKKAKRSGSQRVGCNSSGKRWVRFMCAYGVVRLLKTVKPENGVTSYLPISASPVEDAGALYHKKDSPFWAGPGRLPPQHSLPPFPSPLPLAHAQSSSPRPLLLVHRPFFLVRPSVLGPLALDLDPFRADRLSFQKKACYIDDHITIQTINAENL